jgi:glucosamine--fructose-6-phosphate aminotransferase (isomerizing)
VELTCDEISIYGVSKDLVESRIVQLDRGIDGIDKAGYRHYMLKEIFEQPRAIEDTLAERLNESRVLEAAFGVGAGEIFEQTRAVQIAACGSSYYTALIARYWIEELAGIPCQVEIASEIRYRKVAVQPGTLFVTISQSGETADTLAALTAADDLNYVASLCICNVPDSSLVRKSDLSILIRAGPQMCVVSTKAFTAQLADLLMLSIVLGARNGLSIADQKELVSALRRLPDQLRRTLELNESIRDVAEDFLGKDHALFLGHGIHYPVALEGALKLKEISYIHAEGYPTGELKHGPLDDNMPVVAVAPVKELLEKIKSNLQERRARGGQLLVFADLQASFEEEEGCKVIQVTGTDSITAPIIYTLPIQVLSYHVAVLKGTDVDQPRNLAKSVTTDLTPGH